MKRLLLLPILIALTSCSTKKLKTELKTEIKDELRIELNNQITEYLEREKEFQIEIIPDSLLGIKNWESKKTEYDYSSDTCSFGGNFKFEIKVPDDFTGLIQDYKATYSYKGVERQENFSAYFKNGNQVIGTSIYEYSNSDDNDYLLICSIDNSDDIKLKSFSENVMSIQGVIPKVITRDKD